MEHQCSAILVKHNIECFSYLPLSLTYISNANRYW